MGITIRGIGEEEMSDNVQISKAELAELRKLKAEADEKKKKEQVYWIRYNMRVEKMKAYCKEKGFDPEPTDQEVEAQWKKKHGK